MPRTTLLATPPAPLLVAPAVFDAFAWEPSTVLEWRAPADTLELNDLDPDLPLRMAFVFRAPWDALPAELARLHVPRAAYGLSDEVALAPYGIDDATDQLYAHRRAARDVFWLAADNLNALFWALHDWVHFHNHGAFEERTATEYQCDVTALAWLWINRRDVPLPDDRWEALRAQVHANHLARDLREPPSVRVDDALLADGARLRAFADSLAPAAATDAGAAALSAPPPPRARA